jgi:hypothetical protein
MAEARTGYPAARFLYMTNKDLDLGVRLLQNKPYVRGAALGAIVNKY